MTLQLMTCKECILLPPFPLKLTLTADCFRKDFVNSKKDLFIESIISFATSSKMLLAINMTKKGFQKSKYFAISKLERITVPKAQEEPFYLAI